MSILEIKNTEFDDFIFDGLQKIPKNTDLKLAYGVCPQISISDELSGETTIITQLALISENINCLVTAECLVDFFGVIEMCEIMLKQGDLIDICPISEIETFINTNLQ